MQDFELLDVSLYVEELGRLGIPLGDSGAKGPLEIPEGSVVSLGLTFRLGRDIDAMVFEDTRESDGEQIGSSRTALGGFRTGGPYEVRLPPERLPEGRAHCGVYDVTGRVVDGEGRPLAEEHHRIEVTHEPEAHGPRSHGPDATRPEGHRHRAATSSPAPGPGSPTG
ncbi:hypothetical protein ACGFRB_25780 [Streptomyces sp. NPDC048718]|uniref:hypothetical protein n=1 Tax=Streptomyces sp. NPDC048718 TaxID=3365587 RepID=UPI00371A3B29